MTYEGLRLKILACSRTILCKSWRKKINKEDFTIISNNCWGGMVYESYGLKKQTPTVGMFFMAPDYIRFLKRIHEYLSEDLQFIDPIESRWVNSTEVRDDKRFGKYPIARLSLSDGESIELFFLHYHSEEEAKAKWDKRKSRINWNHILVKFNDMNGCTEKEIEDFINIPIHSKLFFTCKKWNNEERYIKSLGKYYCIIQQFPHSDTIKASFEPFGNGRYIDINEVINKL